MNIITLIILIIFYISSTIILLISIAIYKINQSKMYKIIESYIEKGICLSAAVKLGRFLGVYGQFQVAIYLSITNRKNENK
ncbi:MULTISPECIES: hypothetical protein [Photorhabdus]|uniref:hypothetical protein n=1 Tax=Photorhabdus TaxID=29487 RepID=UPI00131463B0|nr:MULTISPECIES: hypothetical protein [Photorhabdus]